MKIGIYGGSFDPVHLGHLWVAQGCAEQLDLDEVLLIPTATSPLKPAGPVAGNAERVEMLRLALGGSSTDQPPLLRIDQRELGRGGASYTLDTVIDLKRQRPADTFFLLVGSDAFAAIRQWHRPAQLLQEVTPVVFRRGGDPEIDWTMLTGLADPPRIDQIRRCAVTLPMIEVSSSEIRGRVAQQRSIRYRVPAAVETFIHTQRLYYPH